MTVRSAIIPALVMVWALAATGCGAGLGFGNKTPDTLPRVEQAPPPKAEMKPRPLEMARQLVAQGFYDVALVQLDSAAAESGPQPEIEHLRGACFRETGRYDRSEKAFRRAIAIDPEYAPAHNGLGLLYDRQERRGKAAESYARAIELDPARADYFNNLGYSALLDRRLSEAETHLKQAATLDPGHQRALNNLAVCYGLMGRAAESWRLLNRTAEKAKALNNMGVVCQLRGDNNLAREMYTKALENDPDLSAARKNRDLIEALGK